MQRPHLNSDDTRCWIYGTWDFKWPHGYQIQLAFQRLHPELAASEAEATALLEQVITRFMDTAQRWFTQEQPVALSFCDSKERLPAPTAKNQAQSAADSRTREYDILISFAPLPLHLPPKPAEERNGERGLIETQSAELGCYAWRADYGVPTLFLGPVSDGECKPSLEGWLQDRQFQASALHEFGHALGLAHEHQNPLYRARGISLKTKEEILRILAGDPRFKDYPESEIEEEIVTTWPHLPLEREGSVPFSDWRTPPADVELEEHTAMIHPGWSAFLAGAPDGPIAPERTHPTAWDLAQLASMYPRRKC